MHGEEKSTGAHSRSDSCQRKYLTLKEKVEVIRKSNEGNSSRKVAQMFDCGKTQIVCPEEEGYDS